MIAGGNSKYFCVYDIRHRIMIKRITLTNNRTLDGTQVLLNSRAVKDGVDTTLLDSASEPSDYDDRKDDSLPGVQAGKFKKNKHLFKVQAREITLSSTGKHCAVATTEGFSVYYIGDFLSVAEGKFSVSYSKNELLQMAHQSDFLGLVVAGLHLKDKKLLKLAFCKVILAHQVPPAQVDLIVQNLPKNQISHLVNYIGEQLEQDKEVEFLMIWLKPLLLFHSDVLTSKDMETVSNMKNALKSIKWRIDRVAEM